MRHATNDKFFNAADYFLDRNIRQGRGHEIAIYTEHRNYTYNDVQKMVNKTANAMRDRGDTHGGPGNDAHAGCTPILRNLLGCGQNRRDTHTG